MLLSFLAHPNYTDRDDQQRATKDSRAPDDMSISEGPKIHPTHAVLTAVSGLGKTLGDQQANHPIELVHVRKPNRQFSPAASALLELHGQAERI